MRKLLNHLQQKRKDGTEEQPILIGSTEPSHLNSNDRLFILNRPLSSSLKPSFSCLLEFEPRDHLDGGGKKKPSLNIYCSVSPRGGAPRSDTGGCRPLDSLLPPSMDAAPLQIYPEEVEQVAPDP